MASDYRSFRITRHAAERAAEKGIDLAMVRAILANPEFAYDSQRHPGQRRLCGQGIVVVVDEARRTVPTVHVHCNDTR